MPRQRNLQATSSVPIVSEGIAASVKMGRKRTVQKGGYQNPKPWKLVALGGIQEQYTESCDLEESPVEDENNKENSQTRATGQGSNGKPKARAARKNPNRKSSKPSTPETFQEFALKSKPLHNNYPKHVSHQKNRFDFTEDGPIMILGTNKTCFICKESDSENNGILEKCEGNFCVKEDGSVPCNKYMHRACTEKYNSGAMMIIYAARPENQDKLLCPDHVCRACDMENRKQRAYAGEFIRCKLCISSYHRECLPAGSRIETVKVRIPAQEAAVEIETLICPAHFEKHQVPAALQLCSCGSSRNLSQCVSCPQAFHASCRKVRTVDGERVSKEVCDECAQQRVLMIKDLVIVSLKSRQRCANFDIGFVEESVEEGIVRVKLVKGGNVVSVPLSAVLRMKKEYITKAAKKDVKLWKDAFEEYSKFKRFDALCKTVRHTVRTLVKKGAKAIMEDDESVDCDCTGENRCAEGSDCINRVMEIECPESCENKGGCGNREVAQFKLSNKMVLIKDKVKGYGVAATQLIKKGEFLGEYAGEVISKKEFEKRQNARKWSKDTEVQRYLMQLASGAHVDAAAYGNITRYINHSCEPNAVSRNKSVPKKKNVQTAVFIEAARDIQAGDEITITYNWSKNDFNCQCGSAICMSRA